MTTSSLARVLQVLPRTPPVREALTREELYAHRCQIIRGAGVWLRDSPQIADDLDFRMTDGPPRSVWIKFSLAEGDLFRYSLYFPVTQPTVVTLWVETGERPQKWSLLKKFDLAGFSGQDLAEEMVRFLDSDEMYETYRWLDGE
jgi:hypothetical protein